jgi:hypothetical protein
MGALSARLGQLSHEDLQSLAAALAVMEQVADGDAHDQPA